MLAILERRSTLDALSRRGRAFNPLQAIAGFGAALSAAINVLTFFGIAWGIAPFLLLGAIPLIPLGGLLLIPQLSSAESNTFFARNRWGASARDQWDAVVTMNNRRDALAILDRNTSSPGSREEDEDIARVARLYRFPFPLGALAFGAAYAIANFFVTLSLLQGGQPERTASGYYLMGKAGRIIAPLSASEYAWSCAHLERLSSAYALAAFLASAAMFSALRPSSPPNDKLRA